MSAHNKHQSSSPTSNKPSDSRVDAKPVDQSEDKVETKSQDADSEQSAGKQMDKRSDLKTDSKTDGKADTKTEAKSPRTNAIQPRQAGQQQFDKDQSSNQGGLGSINLSEILPDFNSEDIAGFGEKITAYAEEKPLQTMGWAVAGGALVGWLLISKQGQSLLRTSASIAAPFVGNLLANSNSNRQGANADVEAPLKH